MSSDARSPLHRIAPIPVRGDPGPFWDRVRRAVGALPRTTIVHDEQGVLRAECRSRLGFVDDVELRLRAAEGSVAVRSSHRQGMWDLAVNRRRVVRLRRALR